MKIAILGGGLAGCAAAYVLKRGGHEPVIYEVGGALASGASGNTVALYNPRFSAEMNPQSAYFSAAFDQALGVFAALKDIDFTPCGALHLINDEKKAIRFGKMVQSWGWPDDEMRIVSAREASEIAGIEIPERALYLARSGSVSPQKLCAAYAQGVEVRLHSQMDPAVKPQDDELGEYDVVILACGPALRHFEESKHLDLQAVRGQVTTIKATPDTQKLKCNLCYSGYITKVQGGAHMVGSTFQRWLDHSDVMEEDDADNLEKLGAAVPHFLQYFEVIASRASVRTTSRDYFPVVGRLSDKVYISTAHGSHGVLSSLMAGKVLGAMIEGRELPVSADVIKALSPDRFLD